MTTDASSENERHVSGTINLTDNQLFSATTPAQGGGTAEGPDGMALAAEALFDLDGRHMRGTRLLQGVNTKRLRSKVHGDITAAEDFPIGRKDDHVALAYYGVMKVAGLLSAALDVASDSDISGEVSQLSAATITLLLQTRAVLARRDGEHLESSSGDSPGQ